MNHIKNSKSLRNELEERNNDKYYMFVLVEVDSPFKIDNTVHFI